MKINTILLFLAFWAGSMAFCQTGINNDNSLPDSSAMLDVKSTERGFLLPRMTFEQMSNILNPEEGLMVFCTDCAWNETGAVSVFQDGGWKIFNLTCPEPIVPAAGIHVFSSNQITWKWHKVPIAEGYKWNMTSNYSTAVDVGADTSYTETGLACDTLLYRYIWAYNGCSVNSYPSFLNLYGQTLSCNSCGSFPVIHVAGAVAPVNKTVTYETVTNVPGEPSKCWITSNLGSDHQAFSANDASEPSAGWYWQFNRKQGYKHDGTNRTPNTTWIYSINENSDWLSSNDPCTIELGAIWRIPTLSEWNNVFTSGNWSNWNSPWNSPLRIHAAGRLHDGTSQLVLRGSLGAYWSSISYNNEMGNDLSFFSNNNFVGTGAGDKPLGFPVRCLYVFSTIYAPTVTTAPIITITQTTAISGGTVTSDGGATVTARGICWDTSPNPTISGYHTTNGGGTGTFQSFMNNLSINTQYHVRGYATNSIGTSYGNDLTFTTLLVPFNCGDSITYENQTYHSVKIGAQCWLRENMNIGSMVSGTTAQTNNGVVEKYCFNNLNSNCNTYGGLYQWHEMMQYSTTPGAQGICPNGWHLPTDPELTLLNTYLGEFISGGKMKEQGTSHWLSPNTGATNSSGFTGLPAGVFYWPGLFLDIQAATVYWTSTELLSPGSAYRRGLGYSSTGFYRNDAGASMGYSVRCLNNSTYPVSITVSTTPVTNITTTTAVTGGNIISNDGTTVISRGVCYGTTPDITTAGLHTHDGSDSGSYVTNLSGLAPFKTYYIRAYAETGAETFYGDQLAFNSWPWYCGSDITINHHASENVAPVDKTVTYSNVTNIPGEPQRCWVTSNLGADHQALEIGDSTETSAGWYWQFNRKQGYKNSDQGIIPNNNWIYQINENTDWQSSNDPCSLELGSNWRVPTMTEWMNVDAVGGWTDWNGPWNSALKLHAAGYLNTPDGAIMNSGSIGQYWSKTQQSYLESWNLHFTKMDSQITISGKSTGMPIRCIW